MRPIDNRHAAAGQPGAYSGATQLQRPVEVMRAVNTSDPGPPRFAKTTETVEALANELEQLFDDHLKDVDGRWVRLDHLIGDGEAMDGVESETVDVEGIMESLLQLIGTGYEEATASLIDDTGGYCAYCEAADRSGLRADPVAPVFLLPRDAFDREKLLLACEPCRERKRKYLRGEAKLIWNASLDLGSNMAQKIAEIAWPHLYWREGDALPFEYTAYWSSDPDLSDAQVMDEDDEQDFLDAYRRGRFGVARDLDKVRSPRLVFYLQPEDPDDEGEGEGEFDAEEQEEDGARLEAADDEALFGDQDAFDAWYVEVRVSAAQDTRLADQVNETIEMLDLNCRIPDPLDRRQELRAKAYFAALDWAARLGEIATVELPDDARHALDAASEQLLATTIRGTGFWSVWKDILPETAGCDDQLMALPGTAWQSEGAPDEAQS